MSLRQLEVYVPALIQTEGAMLRRALLPDEYGADWTRLEHLLALVHDQLAIANWQRAGGKRNRRPKPISPLAKSKATKYGKTQMAPDQARAYLARFGPPPS